MRLFYFIQDLLLITALAAGSAFCVLAFNPPSLEDQAYCQRVNGGGLDYTACVIERSYL